MTQDQEFLLEKRKLRASKEISKHSKLLSLRPFLDEDEIMRVTGRLQESDLPFGEKHPIILPYKHPLTSLIIDDAHEKTLHGGNNLTLSYLRQRYWIIKGYSAVKQHIHKCVKCHRYNQKAQEQLMGNLPRPRLTVTRPFTNSGVDYAGPIDIRMSKGRGNKSYKGYIAIFICLATKAIHIEVVSDLTAEGFLAAFKRFIARRGNVVNLYSDNGTNFVLANKICQREATDYMKKYSNTISHAMTQVGTQWHFIPPSSPHFGGLWEAGVKSIKFHLKRVIGDTKLTFEELSTVLTQIEACLNSRPLCSIHDDPDDLDVLTPGHFLIGTSLLAPPSPDRLDQNINSLTRWQLLDRLRQEFWRKWSTEYLSRLQQRPKWTTSTPNLQAGEVVLIKDDRLPPNQWFLGRILETHPGKDGLVRVATVKTRMGTVKRPVTKLCPLPVKNQDESIVTLETKSTISPEQTKTVSKHDTTSTLTTLLVNSSQQPKGCKSHLEGTRSEQGSNQESSAAPVDYAMLRRKEVREAMRKRAQANPRKIRINPVEGYSQLVPQELQNQAIQRHVAYYATSDSKATTKRSLPQSDHQIGKTVKLDEQVRTAPDQPRQPTNKKTSQLGKIMTLLLVTLLVVPAIATSADSPIEVIPFITHPGLYFEQVGDVRMITNEWNIIVYYDLRNYWAELQGFRNSINHLSYLCKTIKTEGSYCEQIWMQLNHHLEVMEHNNEILHKRHGNEEYKPRVKRSPLDIIGTIANTLFGILDQNDAKYFEDQIGKLRENDKHLLELIKNQTLILESTNNVFKRNMNQIQSQFDILKNHITGISTNLHLVTEELQEEKLNQMFTSLAVHATLMVINYQRVQMTLLDVLTDAQNGRIHPSLLTPTQLRNQLAVIRENLPSTLLIPGDDQQDDLLQLYKLITARTRLTTQFALFNLKIPLLYSDHYQLFKLTPVPTPHDGKFVFIEPSSDYIIVSLHRDRYYPLTQTDLQACTSLQGESYLCKQRHPIYNLQSNISHCEMSLLNHQSRLSSDCKVRTTEPSIIWIQLHQPNSWIYVLDKEYVFNIVCGKKIIVKRLGGDGILKLHSNCIIKQRSMTISSHNIYSTRVNASLVPLTNLTFQLAESNATVNKGIMKSESMWRFDTRESSIINQAIVDLKKQEHILDDISSHDVHHYTISYLILTIVLGATGYIIYRRIFHRVAVKERPPQPAPRFNVPASTDFVLQCTTEGENV